MLRYISLLGYKGFLLGVPDFGACRGPKTLQGPQNCSTMETPYISSWLDHQMFNCSTRECLTYLRNKWAVTPVYERNFSLYIFVVPGTKRRGYMDRQSYCIGGSGVVHGDNKQSTLSITGNLPSTSSWFLEQGEEVIWISSRTVLAAQWSCTGTISSIPVLTAQMYPLHLRGS